MFASFGNGKWKALEKEYGIEGRLKAGAGRRILYKDGNTWVPMLRYIGLSEWQKQRDIDDPRERHIFFDEYIVPDIKLKKHLGGNPAEHFLDIWVSLRRGKPANRLMTFLLAGNPELGVDWFTPYLGIEDKRTPETVKTYRLPDSVRERYSDDLYLFEKFTIFTTTNIGGAGMHNGVSGFVKGAPERLVKRRTGTERVYCQIDFGGHVSIWYGDGVMIVDTVKVPHTIIKEFPDGRATTIVYAPRVKKDLQYLRDFWRESRVRFANADAWQRFTTTVLPKIL